MPNIKKIAKVKNLKEKVKKAKSLVFLNYQGLTHKQLEELRKTLKDSGDLEIIKNTLLKLSFSKELNLTGPTALLMSLNDKLSALRLLSKFIKKYQLPKIKLGIFGEKTYNEEEVTRMANLPSKEILLAQVIGEIKGPINGLVYTLNGNLQKLVLVLSEIKKNN